MTKANKQKRPTTVGSSDVLGRSVIACFENYLVKVSVSVSRRASKPYLEASKSEAAGELTQCHLRNLLAKSKPMLRQVTDQFGRNLLLSLCDVVEKQNARMRPNLVLTNTDVALLQ